MIKKMKSKEYALGVERMDKGKTQELRHKFRNQILEYWGEDIGILIGITPIYKRRLWSEEVNVINDKQ